MTNTVEEAPTSLEVMQADQPAFIHLRGEKASRGGVGRDSGWHDDACPTARPDQAREHLREEGIGIDVTPAGERISAGRASKLARCFRCALGEDEVSP